MWYTSLITINIKKILVLTDPNAQKLLQKIIDDLKHNGIITNTLVDDLKELRPYAVEEKRPAVAKSIRLTYQHVDEFGTFTIPIPEDDDILEEETNETIISEEGDEHDPKESLLYLMSLLKNEEHKRNKEEIREYNEALRDY